ncbi:hypothetical protein [Nannocystis pusilla]|uniref:hypothetical protein n=1 Tax=Nannocystis pusilla TaxID=889268 RepID=UPI003B76E90E
MENAFTIEAVPGGKALVTAVLASATSLAGRHVIVNVRQAGTGGHASLDVLIGSSECIPSRPCTSEIELPLVLRPSRLDEIEDDDELELELSFGLHAVGGPVFTPMLGLQELWFAEKQPPHTISMRGSYTYERVRYTATPQPFNPRSSAFQTEPRSSGRSVASRSRSKMAVIRPFAPSPRRTVPGTPTSPTRTVACSMAPTS